MQTTITPELIYAFTQCRRKAFLLLTNPTQSPSHEYLTIIYAEAQKAKASYICNLKEKHPELVFDISGKINESNSIFVDVSLRWEDLAAKADIVRRKQYSPLINEYYLEPTIIIGTYNISYEQTIFLFVAGYLLSQLYNQTTLSGRIITADQRSHRVQLEPSAGVIIPILAELRKWQHALSPSPNVILNKHCQTCSFQKACYAKALETDHLSLISGMSKKEIEMQNKRGIFTVTQYAYTYHARKRYKDGEKKPKYYHALKALSIRDKQIYIVQKPKVILQDTLIFIDVEGIPDKDFHYLIGLLISHGSSIRHVSLWAENEKEEETIWNEFLAIIGNYTEFSIIHYGGYETDFIKRMSKRYSGDHVDLIEHIIHNSINVLELIYANIYFPTYSNSLKEIGVYLGANWSQDEASGLQSIVWRHQWELTKDDTIKQKLITYNMEDCHATEKVLEVILTISGHSYGNNNSALLYSAADDVKFRDEKRKFRKNKFALDELEFINQCAYFDYQRERVFLRDGKKEKKSTSPKLTSLYLKAYPPDEIIEITKPESCVRCGCYELRSHGMVYKTVFDLQFFTLGVSKFVTRYVTKRAKCKSCNSVFCSREFSNISGKYGYGLKVWVTYQIIALRQSYTKVLESLQNLFGYYIDEKVLYRAKVELADYYLETYEKILSKIRNGHLAQVDETRVSIKGYNCYVWVFTNIEEVAYVYSPTREATILTNILREFDGVLVSDFYGAYDSMKCEQQKCLIHLIRDMNDDLLKNPFDEFYKNLIQTFSKLVKSIILTIDEYGLCQQYLSKHKESVNNFFENLEKIELPSAVFKKYQKRLLDHRTELFTFLDHDNVPWNNNNAEHAIKEFAAHRKLTDGFYTAEGMKRHLILLSIYATCKYKNVDFLKFLLSREKDIDKFKINDSQGWQERSNIG